MVWYGGLLDYLLVGMVFWALTTFGVFWVVDGTEQNHHIVIIVFVTAAKSLLSRLEYEPFPPSSLVRCRSLKMFRKFHQSNDSSPSLNGGDAKRPPHCAANLSAGNSKETSGGFLPHPANLARRILSASSALPLNYRNIDTGERLGSLVTFIRI